MQVAAVEVKRPLTPPKINSRGIGATRGVAAEAGDEDGRHDIIDDTSRRMMRYLSLPCHLHTRGLRYHLSPRK